MPSHSEMAIEFEARRLWEASGRPIWSHPLDHWSEAIGSLAGRSAAQKARVPRYGPGRLGRRSAKAEGARIGRVIRWRTPTKSPRWEPSRRIST